MGTPAFAESMMEAIEENKIFEEAPLLSGSNSESSQPLNDRNWAINQAIHNWGNVENLIRPDDEDPDSKLIIVLKVVEG